MELSEKYKIELANLHNAVSSFEAELNATFDNLDSIGNDLIQNGRIQKFEYCAELASKISKTFGAFGRYNIKFSKGCL